MKTSLIMAGLLFVIEVSGQSVQNPDHSNNAVKKVLEDFNTPKLSSANVQAFENRGIQKIRDYLDFIAIISDKKYDSTFRQYAINQAEKLFDNQSSIIKERLDLKTDQKSTVHLFLNKIYKTNYGKITTGLTNPVIVHHLRLNNDSNYTGTITFKQTMTFYDKQNNIVKTTKTAKTAILIVRLTPKVFGTETMRIWEVALGSIE